MCCSACVLTSSMLIGGESRLRGDELISQLLLLCCPLKGWVRDVTYLYYLTVEEKMRSLALPNRAVLCGKAVKILGINRW